MEPEDCTFETREKLVAFLKQAPFSRSCTDREIRDWIDRNIEFRPDGTMRNRIVEARKRDRA